MEVIMTQSIFSRSFPFRAIRIAGISIAALFVLSISTDVGAGWLDKGQKLLQSVGGGEKHTELSAAEIGAGLKDALRVGSENVIARLGRVDGFNTDPAVHIPLPKQLKTVQSALSKVGMSSMLEDLELKLNRAAEAATPKAKKLFKEAIVDMSFDDAKKIYNGPKDAATRYFKGKMSPELIQDMRPVVKNSLAKVGAVQSYDNVMTKYRSLPFVPDVKTNLTNYVVEKGIDGVFYYMAKEEAAIRENPVKRTTEVLRKVFGSK